MKTTSRNDLKRGSRAKDFPELQVGFPERNDVTNPIDEMERIHVDLETMDISRKNAEALTREIASADTSGDKK